jgi:MYXO-CTERM domain-containing protein
MLRSPLPLLVSALAFAAAFHATGTARAAGECEVDDDCGHGFACEDLRNGGTGGTGGTGSGTGGTSGDTPGSGAFGAGAAAGTGTGGSGSGAPLPPNVCGNGLCEPSESAASCAADCEPYNYCVPAECTSASDCAEGYSCPEPVLPGTGGAASAPFCGDGLCTGANENVDTCPADCVGTSYCTPESGYCTSDAECAAGFYCSFMGSGSGSGGAFGTGGSAGADSGSAGTGSATGGAPAVGGSAGMADAGFAPPAGASGTGMGGEGGESSKVPNPGTGGSSGIVAGGTCMPREMSGTGGTVGTGGTLSAGGAPATGGTGSGGMSTGGSEPTAGSEQGGSGSEPPPAGSGGTGTGSGGTAPTGSGARNSGGAPAGSSGGTRPVSDEGDGDGKTVTHAGCSVARTDGSSFGAFALLALAFAGIARRRTGR